MNQDELAYEVARLYFVEGLTQQAIAERLKLSRPKVSRLLTHARRRGIVEIKLNPPASRSSDILAEALRDRLKLSDVRVVDPDSPSYERMLSGIVRAGADYISSVLENGQVVGWGWGRTVFQTVHYLHRTKQLPSSLFVPLIGGAGQFEKHYQVNSMVERTAEMFGARFMYLNAPAFFNDANTLSSFRRENHIRRVIETWKHLDVAVFGLGKPVYDSEILKTEIDPELIVELIREKAVGDILARFFKENGDLCSSRLNDLILGIDLSDLKKAPLRICLCGGEKKVDGIIAASKKEYFNVLITDSLTTELILERLRREERT